MSVSGQIEPLAALRQAVSDEPLSCDNRWRLAAELVGQCELDEAIRQAQHATRLDPRNSRAWAILGACYNAIGDWATALECHNRSLRIAPNTPSPRWNRFWANLAMGNIQEAWEDQEHGRRIGIRPNRLIEDAWQGEDIEGQTLLVWGEQGLGDQIQFARWLPIIRERFKCRIILEVDPLLVRLLEPLADIVAAQPADFSCAWQYDKQIPLLSLPLMLGRATGEWRIPNGTYLPIPHNPTPGYVGLVWKGRPTHPNDHNRSLTRDEAQQFQGIVTHDFTFGEDPIDGAEYVCGPDYLDTAYRLAECEQLVSVDSGVAHLAGAMGIPTRLILPLTGEGRWGVDGPGNLWYPNHKLYRPTDFETTLAEVLADLA